MINIVIITYDVMLLLIMTLRVSIIVHLQETLIERYAVADVHCQRIRLLTSVKYITVTISHLRWLFSPGRIDPSPAESWQQVNETATPYYRTIPVHFTQSSMYLCTRACVVWMKHIGCVQHLAHFKRRLICIKHDIYKYVYHNIIYYKRIYIHNIPVCSHRCWKTCWFIKKYK